MANFDEGGSTHDETLWDSRKSPFAGVTVTYLPGVTVSTLEQRGGEVRWNGGVLEQAWQVQHIGTTGAIEKIEIEWRPVPSVDQ